jgi:hypothetical protein
VANLPQPEVLSRNGSYMAYRRLKEHVAVFRDYLRENSNATEDEELLRRSSWGVGATERHSCWRRTRTIPNSAQTPCATTTSTTRRWIRSATRVHSAPTPAG